MPKPTTPPNPKESITVVSTSPSHADGLIYQNDAVVFAIDPPDSGVITVYGSRDGQVLASWSLPRGSLTAILTPSQPWTASPGPLHAEATLNELVNGKVKVLADMTFEIAG